MFKPTKLERKKEQFMAFKPVTTGGDSTLLSPTQLAKDGKTGVIMEGIFTGTDKHINKENGQETTLYIVEEGEGKITKIFNAGNLGYKMGQVKIGDVVQIHYNGKQKASSGPRKGTPMHSFDVYVDDGNE